MILICYCNCFSDPPRIETYPKDQTVASGGIAVFVCTAVGNPNPQIEWRKNGKRVTTQRYAAWDMPNGSVLRIEPVRAGRDDATYECVAENGVGEPVRALADLNVLPGKVIFTYLHKLGFRSSTIITYKQFTNANRAVKYFNYGQIFKFSINFGNISNIVRQSLAQIIKMKAKQC